jgi:hypothetical protein
MLDERPLPSPTRGGEGAGGIFSHDSFRSRDGSVILASLGFVLDCREVFGQLATGLLRFACVLFDLE